MKITAYLLCGILTVTAIYGFSVPLDLVKTNPVKNDDQKIGPQYLEEAMQKLWDKHTLIGPGKSTNCPSPQMTTNTSGNFEGSVITGKCMTTSLTEREIYSFQGLRFGGKPDNTTKFKPPTRVNGKFWDGDTFEAIAIGNKCPQGAMVGNNVAGNIDCLFLNVYTPIMPEDITDPLPVMFFIYGGSFTTGDASLYLPTKLLEHDVILVTIHYRLGAQGFFTLGNEDAPGNTALYDMITALEWVQDNIAEFGGDPEKVTIFGESAGSASVNYLMLTPGAKGLFRGVIAESGSALDVWSFDSKPDVAAKYIAEYVGCYESDAVNFDCMLTVSDEDLVHAEGSLVAADRKSGGLGFNGAAPVSQTADLIVNGRSPLITKHPKYYFIDGDFNDVAFMTGSNRDEGSYVFGEMYNDFMLPNGLETNEIWMREQMIQQILLGIGVVDETYSIAKSLEERYCPGIDLGIFYDSTGCMIDLIGSLFLKAGSWQTCKYHTYYGMNKSDTFYYSFDFESEDSMYNWLLPPADWETGVTHSDELPYIFAMPVVIDEYQIYIEKVMTKLWTNFATYLDPTPDEDTEWEALHIPKWLPYMFEDPHYMLIEKTLKVETEYSERWTVSTDDSDGFTLPSRPTNGPTDTTEEPTTGGSSHTTDNTGTTISGEPSTATAGHTTTPAAASCDITQDEYDDLKQKSDAYEITMIIFIVAFVIVCGVAAYFFFKARN